MTISGVKIVVGLPIKMMDFIIFAFEHDQKFKKFAIDTLTKQYKVNFENNNGFRSFWKPYITCKQKESLEILGCRFNQSTTFREYIIPENVTCEQINEIFLVPNIEMKLKKYFDTFDEKDNDEKDNDEKDNDEKDNDEKDVNENQEDCEIFDLIEDICHEYEWVENSEIEIIQMPHDMVENKTVKYDAIFGQQLCWHTFEEVFDNKIMDSVDQIKCVINTRIQELNYTKRFTHRVISSIKIGSSKIGIKKSRPIYKETNFEVNTFIIPDDCNCCS